jgi:hypothetical protein
MLRNTRARCDGTSPDTRLRRVWSPSYGVRAMRFSLPALALTLLGCGDEPAPEATSDPCQRAYRVHGEALADAIESAPDCSEDADCVVMDDRASCQGLVEVDLCDLSVHSEVLELYDPVDVSRRMCEAARGSRYACSISAACAEHGAPVCHEGRCEFESP